MNERDKRIGVGLSIVDDGMRRVAISFIRFYWFYDIGFEDICFDDVGFDFFGDVRFEDIGFEVTLA